MRESNLITQRATADVVFFFMETGGVAPYCEFYCQKKEKSIQTEYKGAVRQKGKQKETKENYRGS